MKKLLLLLITMSWMSVFCAAPIGVKSDAAAEKKQLSFILEQDSASVAVIDSTGEVQVKFKRGKAIIFTILTGLLGGHRIYLGTHHRTPIIYSVTLGGLGILPLVDLVNIMFTKDIRKFEDKSQIIMWGK